MEKIALIGFGYWGKKVFRYLQESEKFDLTYVYFRSLQDFPQQKMSEKWPRGFVSQINTIWKDKSVKNVFIATPAKTHFEIAKAALINQKNVLVEKPLTLKADEALQLAKLAKYHDCKVLTDYTYTFSKSLLKAKGILDRGEIGKIKTISMSLRQLGRFLEYDVYIILGSHCLSMLDMFSSLKKFIFKKYDLIKTKKRVSGGIIYFESRHYDIKGFIDVCLNCPQREKKVIFYGEKGTLIYDPLSENTLKIFQYKQDKGLTGEVLLTNKKEYNFDENNNLQYLIDTFYTVVKGKVPDNLERAVTITNVLEELSAN